MNVGLRLWVHVVREEDHQGAGTVDDAVLAIDPDVVSPVISSPANDVLQLKLTCWVLKLLLIDILLNLRKLKPLIPYL